MNIDSIYNKIIDNLEKAGLTDNVKNLEDLLAKASTGSEALSLTGKYLFDLLKTKSVTHNSIKPLILEYLKYCEINGIAFE